MMILFRNSMMILFENSMMILFRNSMMIKSENCILSICAVALVFYTAICGFHKTVYAEL